MESSRGWGPEHQDQPAPGQSSATGRRITLGLVGVFVVWVYGLLHPGSHPFTTLTRDGLIVGGLVLGYRFLVAHANREPASDAMEPTTVASSVDPLGSVRDHAAGAGGGAYLGANRGSWVFADPEHGVLLLGPPRSGKTSGVVIPALLACPGACVSTSTKLDVLHATLGARQRSGEVWLFDPTGEHAQTSVEGVRRLSWSPVAAAGTWDHALVMARAMTLAAPTVGRGTQHEQHWSERAGALLGPLLYAANRSGRPIADVLRWVLRHDLSEPGVILEREHADVACDVVEGIARTDERERSSIFSATAGVLALYNTDSAVRRRPARISTPTSSRRRRTPCSSRRPRTARRCVRRWSSGCWSRSVTRRIAGRRGARTACRCSSAWMRLPTSRRSTTSRASSPRPVGKDCMSSRASRT
jgi:hypothetical protein